MTEHERQILINQITIMASLRVIFRMSNAGPPTPNDFERLDVSIAATSSLLRNPK